MPGKQYDSTYNGVKPMNGPAMQGRGLPPCTLRLSSRARRVVLSMTRRDGLVLVAPPGFDPAMVPEILARRREWIERTLTAMQVRFPDFDPWTQARIPERLDLRCIGENWDVDVLPGSGKGRALLRINAGRRLMFRAGGKTPGEDGEDSGEKNTQDARALLCNFLVRKARPVLPELLSATARQTGFSYTKCQIRTQSGRWGSCSGRGTISLNAKLLFLPEHLVRYVCIHELCHTRHLDHSDRFHALVRDILPQAEALERELNCAEALVPRLLA